MGSPGAATPFDTRTYATDSEGFPAFVQDLQVGVIHKDAVAALAGVFAGDTGGDQVHHALRRGREVHGTGLAHLPEGKHRAPSKGGEHPQRVGGPATQGLNPAGVMLEERHEAASRLHRAQRRSLDAFEEEIHPRFPIAPGADAIEQIVVGGPVLFEVKAQEKGQRCRTHDPIDATRRQASCDGWWTSPLAAGSECPAGNGRTCSALDAADPSYFYISLQDEIKAHPMREHANPNEAPAVPGSTPEPTTLRKGKSDVCGTAALRRWTGRPTSRKRVGDRACPNPGSREVREATCAPSETIGRSS